MYYTLDNTGNPVKQTNLNVWSKWMESFADRTVARDEINGLRISTVFLGIDHNFGVTGDRPILWETMVFRIADNDDLYQERYSSLADAKSGHTTIVEQIKRSGGWRPL